MWGKFSFSYFWLYGKAKVLPHPTHQFGLQKMQTTRRLFQTHPPLLFAAFCSSPPTLLMSLKVGDILKERRRFTDFDVVGYSAASGDRNPIHFDHDFARQIGGFEHGRVVHGLLVSSLFPSVVASNFPGAIYVAQSLQFKLPVYVEEDVVAEVQATNIRATNGKYYVKWSTKCYTNGEFLVIDGEATTILPKITLRK